MNLRAEFGEPVYDRVEAPATPEQKERLRQLSAHEVRSTELAGETIQNILTDAPGNGASIGGLKVVTEERMVRCASLRHGEHLQDLCGELPRRQIICAASWKKHRPS